MNKQYTGKDYSKTKAQGEVNIDDLDELAERSFPLCMKALHRGLKAEHKLKHFGRLQYGLFIKVQKANRNPSKMVFFSMVAKILIILCWFWLVRRV